MHLSVPYLATGEGGSQRRHDATRQIVWFPAGRGPGSHLPAAQCGKGCGRCESAKVGHDPWTNMDRPKPGGWVPLPPTAASRQPPPRRWKFARLISSSHPPSGRVLFASLSVGRLLDLGTLAPSLTGLCAVRCAVCHCTCRMSRLDDAASIKMVSVSPVSCSHDTRQLHEHVWPQQGGNDPPHVARKACLAGVTPPPTPMPIVGVVCPWPGARKRRGADSQTHGRVSTARGAFLIREKASSRVLPRNRTGRQENPEPSLAVVCLVDAVDDDVVVVVRPVWF